MQHNTPPRILVATMQILNALGWIVLQLDHHAHYQAWFAHQNQLGSVSTTVPLEWCRQTHFAHVMLSDLLDGE